jgi:hypothetical protein
MGKSKKATNKGGQGTKQPVKQEAKENIKFRRKKVGRTA